MSVDPSSFARLRYLFYGGFQPAWWLHAACTELVLPGRTAEEAFKDEMAQMKDETDCKPPKSVQTVMKLCGVCPVRRECLESAFVEEQHIDQEAMEEWFADHRPEAVWSENQRRFGVRGGTPGRVREFFARDEYGNPAAGRLERCEEWFQNYAETEGWAVTEEVRRIA